MGVDSSIKVTFKTSDKAWFLKILNALMPFEKDGYRVKACLDDAGEVSIAGDNRNYIFQNHLLEVLLFGESRDIRDFEEKLWCLLSKWIHGDIELNVDMFGDMKNIVCVFSNGVKKKEVIRNL